MIAIASELLFKGMCSQKSGGHLLPKSSIKSRSVVSMTKNYLTFEYIFEHQQIQIVSSD